MELSKFKENVDKLYGNYIYAIRYHTGNMENYLITDICNIIYDYCELEYVVEKFNEQSRWDKTLPALDHREGYKLYNEWHLVVLYRQITPNNFNMTWDILTTYDNGVKNGLEGGNDYSDHLRYFRNGIKIFEKKISFYHGEIEWYIEESYDPETKITYVCHDDSDMYDNSHRILKKIVNGKIIETIKKKTCYMSENNQQKLFRFDFYNDVLKISPYWSEGNGYGSVILYDFIRELEIEKHSKNGNKGSCNIGYLF
ncbi:MAG: hypothetical protein Edafosvirus5_58 [Edafosvirus sp.]|uniref:Uncharacterized protein n=1 Tax=Edafosvirus sp. TaxID=2487765 RepID=A0A3G4ZTB6_9VIRU|nr:MAG: hypothetical protein Edafosvirus5_58 [Edafosvirus sp.]